MADGNRKLYRQSRECKPRNPTFTPSSVSSEMNNSGQLNSFKFGEKVIKADYSSESNRVTGFLLANISL